MVKDSEDITPGCHGGSPTQARQPSYCASCWCTRPSNIVLWNRIRGSHRTSESHPLTLWSNCRWHGQHDFLLFCRCRLVNNDIFCGDETLSWDNWILAACSSIILFDSASRTLHLNLYPDISCHCNCDYYRRIMASGFPNICRQASNGVRPSENCFDPSSRISHTFLPRPDIRTLKIVIEYFTRTSLTALTPCTC